MTKKWLIWWESVAQFWAQKSKDQSTKIGAVAVDEKSNRQISVGYNGFPRGINDDAERRHERPQKYKYTEHAERNLIYNAAREVLEGTTLFLNFAPCPCTDCTRAIIQSGIKRVVGYSSKPFPGKGEHWEEDLKIAREMLAEAGIEIVDIDNLDDDDSYFIGAVPVKDLEGLLP